MPRFEEVSNAPGPPQLPVPVDGGGRRNWRALVAVGLGGLTALGFAWFANRPSGSAREAAAEFASPAEEPRAPSGVESAAAQSRFLLESAESVPVELESAPAAEPLVSATEPPPAVEGPPAGEANSGTAKLTIEVFGSRPPPPPPPPPGSNF